MHIEKQYRELENVEEVRVYNMDMNEVFHEVEPVRPPEKLRFTNVMKLIPSDINVFLPIDEGEDYIIERIGWNLLERTNVKLVDVEGRKLSQVSPFYNEIFSNAFKEVYETQITKTMRIFYELIV